MLLQPSITLSELTLTISESIESAFGSRTFWIIADVINYTYKAQTNFHYFDLVEKDKDSSRVIAKIPGRAWGNAAVNITNFERVTGQIFRNDINVLIQVLVQYNPAFGLQLKVIDIDTTYTLGQFERQRKETLHRLLTNNPSFIRYEDGQYRTRNSDLNLKPVLQRIAVISSETSAGYQDFHHTLENNSYGYQFQIQSYFTLVQGNGNSKQILEQMITLFQSGINYEVLVIIRGGGASTDLLIFDDYELNRAIAKFPIPIMIGVGHQKDKTIADLMAHTSAKTPTKVAELLIAHNRQFEESLLNLQQQIVIKTFQQMSQHKEYLNRINQIAINTTRSLLMEKQRDIMRFSAKILRNPLIIISQRRNELSNLISNFKSYNKRYFISQERNIEHVESIVQMMSPRNILNKGFAILKVDDKILSDSRKIEPGMEVTIILADAEIKTVISSKSEGNGNQFDI